MKAVVLREIGCYVYRVSSDFVGRLVRSTSIHVIIAGIPDRRLTFHPRRHYQDRTCLSRASFRLGDT